MTKRSGVPGKTVYQLARSKAAAKRQAQRAERDATAQLALLDQRPGESRSERLTLGYTILKGTQDEDTKVARSRRARRSRDAE